MAFFLSVMVQEILIPSARESNFCIPGGVKNIGKIHINYKEYMVLAKNSDYLQLVRINKGQP